MPLITKFPYGKQEIKIEIPKQWKLVSFASPKEMPRAKNEMTEIEEAVKNPIACKPLCTLAKGKESVAIMVDDWTRPTQARNLLLTTLEQLNMAGIEDSCITVVVAKGTRERTMTSKELQAKIGREAIERLTIVNHNCDENLDYLGVNASGTPVWINNRVSEADLKIGIGRIVPHEMAGYSGGAKIILPGVSGRKTIGNNHSIIFTLSEVAELLGKNMGNPIREDMEEAANKAELNFVIDQVLNARNRIVKIVAGDFIKAHRQGSRIAQSIYSVRVFEPADVVIVSPEERCTSVEEAIQVTAALRMVKKSGVVILVAPCTEGLGSDTFVRLAEKNDPAECKQKVAEQGWGGAGIAYLYLTGIRKYHPILVSEPMQNDIEHLGMVYAGSINEALEEAKNRLGDYGTVMLVPQGFSIIPVVNK